MATNETLKNQLSQQNQKQVPANQLGLKGLMNTPTMKRKFEEVLHENANAFMSNVGVWVTVFMPAFSSFLMKLHMSLDFLH